MTEYFKENVSSVLKTKQDLELFDEYLKCVKLDKGEVADHKLFHDYNYIIEVRFEYALRMVDKRKQVIKFLEKKDNDVK